MIIRKHLLRDKRNIDPNITPEHSRIGQILSIRREELFYDFSIVEKLSGISRAKLKRIFTGTQDMTLSDMIKITKALKLELKDLF